MVVTDTLSRSRVLFIGTSIPMETTQGIDALQQPLRERYPVNDDSKLEGITSFLTVTHSGLQLEYVDKKDIIFYPINTVILCAAVRCISVINNNTGQRVSKFVSLSSPTASGLNSKRPAIFAVITRRTVGKKVLECHAFICQSDKEAFGLVQATSTADRISKQFNGDSVYSESHKRTDTLKSGMNGSASNFPLRVVSGESHRTGPPELYEDPPENGYFYTSKTSPIKKYTLEKVVSDTEGERLRATSPPPLSARPSLDRRSVYSVTTTRTAGPPPPVLHTLPRPAPSVVPVRAVPVPVRPRFFSPPPPLVRPRVVTRLREPYMMVSGHPPPPPLLVDGPPPQLVRPRNRRRGSASSASHDHGSSRSSSPQDMAYPKRMMNGDGGDASSEVSSRPRTPPTDYDKRHPNKQRISRKEQYEIRSNYYPTVLRNGDVYPPPPHGVPYDYLPQRVPLYYVERARSVPPPVERARTLEKKKGKKNRKEKKSKRKQNGVPSDISADSIGYVSEGPTPSNFKRFENQFKHERAFSRSLMEEKRHVPHDPNQSAYTLNDIMVNKGRNEDEPFHLY